LDGSGAAALKLASRGFAGGQAGVISIAFRLGNPQPQIDAFRCFEISPAFQNTYGYPALTPAIKEKIFGLNAARLLSQLPGVKLP
jgi:hypothetical protein